MKFTKPATRFAEQIAKLKARGMSIPDEARAEHYLGHLNYYRLTGYWLPFESDHKTHTFKPGTTFDDVLSLYVFDRELRLLVLDAIERVEVSVRTQFAYHLAHRYGAHVLLNEDVFVDAGRHRRLVSDLQSDVAQSGEVFMQHLRDTYSDALPPVWACVEVMSFGQLSKWVAAIKRRIDKNQIAHVYDMDEQNLTSFLHHLAIARNICAHHGRLWNREFGLTFRLPTHRPHKVLAALNTKQPRRLYNTLAMLCHMLDVVSGQHHFRQRLFNLMSTHPMATPSAMGFPSDWQKANFWK